MPRVNVPPLIDEDAPYETLAAQFWPGPSHLSVQLPEAEAPPDRR